jgi:predicted TIM-barrel fold metal-dependent hydrolase
MFSTDFPHGTSLSPGPCGGTTLKPNEYAAQGHAALDPELRAKVLSGNAAAIYKLNIHEGRR